MENNIDALMLGSFIVSAVGVIILLIVARFIFSIHTIIYNQRVTLKILEGIAVKLGVDPAFLNRKV